MFRNPTRALLIALALTASLAHAAGGGLEVQTGSKLWITGTSTMHAWSSTASTFDLKFTAAELPAADTPAEAVEQMIRARGVTAVELTVPVAKMRSGKDGLDKNMRKALVAEKHPDIRFTMSAYELSADAPAGTTTVDARGKLTVAGAEREVRLPVTVKRDAAGVRMTGEVTLKMTEFGIKPPTMMMGAVKTGDPVVVHFDLMVAPAGVTGAAAGNSP